jgi:hypothetical protein
MSSGAYSVFDEVRAHVNPWLGRDELSRANSLERVSADACDCTFLFAVLDFTDEDSDISGHIN